MGCTSSMECHIQGAKNSIKKIVDYMADTQAIKVRIGFCGYPPHGRRFSIDLGDNYQNVDPNGLTAERVLEEMQSIIL